jgi:hypothetical protein
MPRSLAMGFNMGMVSRIVAFIQARMKETVLFSRMANNLASS